MQSCFTKFKLVGLFVLLTKLLLAQDSKDYTHWSAGLGMGLPVTIFGINSSPVGYYMVNGRYAFNPKISLEGRATSNIFYNSNTGNSNNGSLINQPYNTSDIRNYRTELVGIHGIMQYQFTELLGLTKSADNNWAPYGSFGAGLYYYKLKYSVTDGTGINMEKFGSKPARDYQLGIGTKYYVNHNLDFNIGAEYHYVESYYLDAASADKKTDNFLNFYIGAQWKIGSKEWKNAAEWSFKNKENTFEMNKNYSKWSVDINTGLPILFNAIGYNLTGMAGIGARHTFSKSFALGGYFHYGKVAGSHDVPAQAPGTPINFSANQVKDFSTTLSQLTLRSYLNIRNLRSEPEVKYKWNHYAVFGVGYIFASQDVNYANGRNRSGKLGNSGVQNIVMGYLGKKYLTPILDLTMGLDYSHNESKWFDAAPDKSYVNSHLYLNIGLSIKLGASDLKENLDWAYQGYSNYRQQKEQERQLPVVMKQDEVKEDTVSRVVEIPSEKEVVKDEIAAEPKDEAEKVSPKVDVEARDTKNAIVKKGSNVKKPATSNSDEPKAKSKAIILDIPKVATANQNNDITPPPMTYNVIVACYHVGKEKVAIDFKNKLTKMGFEPSLYRDNERSRMIRLAIISTNDKATAIKELRKARRNIDRASWIHLYNKQ